MLPNLLQPLSQVPLNRDMTGSQYLLQELNMNLLNDRPYMLLCCAEQARLYLPADP